MELPTWFIVFIILALISLVLIISVAINPSIVRWHWTVNTTSIIEACTDWANEGCSESSFYFQEINKSTGCGTYKECVKVCNYYGLCKGAE